MRHGTRSRYRTISPNDDAWMYADMPYIYYHDDQVDPPEDWQREDIEKMYNRAVEEGGAFNWSEMGGKKTSTGLWLIQRLAKEGHLGEHPNVLAISTRTGKGTFFKLAPHILQNWMIFDVTTRGISVLQNNKLIKIPESKMKFIPELFTFPCLVVGHYNIFSKANKGLPLIDKETGDFVLNEDGLPTMAPFLQSDHIANRKWSAIWIDEIHRIKDKDAKWTVHINRVKGDIKTGSTGTGFINRPHEIWSPINWLHRGLIGGFNDFKKEFCEMTDQEGINRIVGIREDKKDEFRKIVRDLGPRRTLDEVMPHLKQPIFVEREVELNPKQRKMYDEIIMELQTLDERGTPLLAQNVLVLFMRLRAIATATPRVISDYYDPTLGRRVQKIELIEPSSKLDAVMDILDELEWDEERKDQVVIFSNFVGPLKLLEARLNKANRNAHEMGFDPEYPYLWMKTEDSDEKRYRMWNELFPSKQYRIFMSSIQLGSESISLTSARHVIFLDRSWSPKDNKQAIGRIRRPGQEGQPIVININAIDTIDKYVKDINDIKDGWFKQIFG